MFDAPDSTGLKAFEIKVLAESEADRIHDKCIIDFEILLIT